MNQKQIDKIIELVKEDGWELCTYYDWSSLPDKECTIIYSEDKQFYFKKKETFGEELL